MPKIGSGDIASVLPDRDDLLFFASGVSNSREARSSEYAREKELLMDQPKDAHIVYFSSLAIFYSDTLYTRHKRHMETLIRLVFPSYTIIRLGNISFGNNPNTIINFLKKKILNGEPFEVQDVYRYVIDRDEFLHWIGLIPGWNVEMNLPGRRLLVQEIVDEIREGKL